MCDPLDDYICNTCGKKHEFCRCGDDHDIEDEDSRPIYTPPCDGCGKPVQYCTCDEGGDKHGILG